MKKFLIVLLVIIVFIGLIVGLSFGLTAKPRRLAADLVGAMKSGDLNEAYKMTSPAFQDGYSLEKFKEMFQSDKGTFSQITQISFNDTEISNDQAKAFGYIENSDGYRVPVVVDMVKNSGNWKVSGFDFDFGAGYQL